jgi:Type I phosphodiesterase / nucleotide pyrophosphatase
MGAECWTDGCVSNQVDPLDGPAGFARPVVPDYAGANVCGVMPGLVARGPRPDWFPAPLREAAQVVVLVVDGLGWEQLQEHRHLAPTLDGMVGGPITTVAPTTTATALTSIATGLAPGEHGLIGYRVDVRGSVLNVLRWSTERGDARRTLPPREMQPVPAFLGTSVPVVSKAELEHSAFSDAHLFGARHVGWRASSSIPVEVGRQLAAGEALVYAYYDGLDKIAHERGFGPFYESELRNVDRLVGDVLGSLTPGAVLAVIADHGQVQVGSAELVPPADLLRLVHHQSGEGRFRWLHARPGAAAELLAASSSLYGDVAWIVGREEMLDERWFGPAVAAPVVNRLGDVALCAREPVSFHDPADSGPFQLVCRHGSMTPAEVYVPLLCAPR